MSPAWRSALPVPEAVVSRVQALQRQSAAVSYVSDPEHWREAVTLLTILTQFVMGHEASLSGVPQTLPQVGNPANDRLDSHEANLLNHTHPVQPGTTQTGRASVQL